MPISYYNKQLRRHEIYEDDGSIRVIGEADYRNADSRIPPSNSPPGDAAGEEKTKSKRRTKAAERYAEAAKAAAAAAAGECDDEEECYEDDIEEEDDAGEAKAADGEGNQESTDPKAGNDCKDESGGEDDQDEPPPQQFIVYEVREVRQLMKVAYIVEAASQEEAFVAAMNGKAFHESTHGIIEGSLEVGESGWASSSFPAETVDSERGWKKAQDDQIIARMEAECAGLEDDECDEP